MFVDALPLLPEADGDRARVAIDLGCGDGKEALVLLERGWTVLAVDGAPEGIARLVDTVPPGDAGRLTTKIAAYADVELPEADLVYAGFSLPFCDPGDFPGLWKGVVAAIRPKGVFAGNFLGPRDTWFGTPDMKFHTREEVEGLFAGRRRCGRWDGQPNVQRAGRRNLAQAIVWHASGNLTFPENPTPRIKT